jgi:amino acid adenylation domain-containing protein/non-ribosomal peptide synthase protein (TIGR01720 family)
MTQPLSPSATPTAAENRERLRRLLAERDARPRVAPASFAQERHWALHRLDPSDTSYNVPVAVRLRGALDVPSLERALGEVARRHETLRTTLAEQDGATVQVIAPFAGLALPVEEVPGEAAARDRVAAEAAQPFDLAAGPLFEPRLLRLADDDHVLLVRMHHAVTDGWSLGVLFREMWTAYAALREGRPVELAPLPLQYADYAAWQREQAQGPALAGQLAYWREQLTGAPPLELPADRPRPAVRTPRGGSEAVELSAALVERLQALARAEGATLYMVLLAAFQVLLGKYAGSDDVVTGGAIAGRTRSEVEGLIGDFVNTVVLRTDLSGDPAFAEAVRRVRAVTLGAYRNQDVPFERVVAELRPERTASRSPLFQVMFALQNLDLRGAGGGGGIGGVRMEAVEIDAGTAKFDLSLVLSEAPGGGLRGVLDYSADLFDAATARRMARHLARVLEQVAAGADLRLSEIELADDDERRLVVEEWNRVAEAPAQGTLHGRFEARAAQTPDAVAITCGGAALTYRELNARANRLAHHLRRLGVGPETRVGLCLERGMETVAAILAVLKAGGAYVPLDPAYPAERLQLILGDAGVPVLLTQESLHGAVPVPAGVRVVSVDGVSAELAAEPDTNPDGGAGPESLAYVIYTSGSTGTPKGALIEHRNVIRLFTATDPWFGFGSDDVWTLFHSYAFDFSVWEIWGALLYGGRLVVVPFEVSRDPAAFHALVAGEGVTVLSQTPSAFRQLMQADAERGGELALRFVVFGGEALEPAMLREWVRRRGVDAPRLVNMYGITETTVHVTFRPLSHADVFEGAGSPIGVRIRDLRLYVLDPARRLLPVGVPGELYVGGAGVARGYLNRPELTAQRFIDDPFAPGRLYRTGDRVRWLADGTMEYLGRLDEQVKIRGFRIELGEIEAALLGQPGVTECAVIVREDVPGDRRLVAYVAGGADAEALGAAMRRALPEYMVPAAFVAVERLPLTPNGKLDRRALPAPGYAGAGDRYVAPRTPAEETLAAIWADVLRVERVGVDDGFFDLGGDSILAIQVVTRARRAGLELTPRQLFENPSVAALAAVAGTGSASSAPRAEQGRVTGQVPLTPVQAWFFEQKQPAPWHHNQSVLLSVDDALSAQTLETALAAVLEHHDALRLRFRRVDGGWTQWHADEVGIALEHADLSAVAPDAQDRALEQAGAARQAGLDLERGPVGRAVLFERGARGRLLLLVLHHLVVDGVSWRILREDLERACAQVEAGRPVELGDKSTSYRAWALALQAYAAGDALAETEHWRAQGAEGVAPLPRDGTGEATIAGSRGVTVRLSVDETRALLHEVPAAYRAQINDVLLSALAEALGAWAGGSRVRLALEGHGREEEAGGGADLTRTMGWFTSIYPVVLDLTGAEGPGRRLMRVKEQLRAIPRRGIGYGVLRYLSPDAELRAELAAQPEPEVAFNYLGRFDVGLGVAERFRFAPGERGAESAAENRRRYLLEVNGGIAGDQLSLTWSYAEGAHRSETVERVANAHLDALRALIAHCRQPGAGGCTPSDFPLAALTQDELDAALAGQGAVEDLYPLTPLQEGILFHALAGAGEQAYQVQVALRLEGELDVDLFRRAWAEVGARHAVLRTSFAWDGLRRPLQRVHAAAELPWTVEDWSGLAEDEQEPALERFLAADRARGFDLGAAPLMRFALLRLAGGAHWFVSSEHHLLMDGWSSSRVRNEAFRLYRAWSDGQTPEPARVRPFRDYVGWLARQDRGAAERFWRDALEGFPAPTPLGVDRPAAAGATPRWARHETAFDAARTRRLEEAARRERVTLNTLLQGAWALLLQRYSGEADVVFGATVSGRPAALDGVEEMVGLFINTLPVLARPRAGAPVGEWLRELQSGQARAREHEHVPLSQVQEWSEVPRGTPLFESLFVFENYLVERGAAGAAAPGGLRVAPGRAVEWTTYPLTLLAAPGAEMPLSLWYDENRFAGAAVERMMEHLQRLLDALADESRRTLAQVDPLGDAERETVLREWNRTAAPFPSTATIHGLFAAQAARTPDAVAATWERESLSYRELDARANRLAHHLRALGVGPEARVGVLLERTLQPVVALLAVLKAGGAYVPLDPAYPAERLAFTLADSGVGVLVTQESLHGHIPVPASVRVVSVDGDADAIARASEAEPADGATARNLAYLIYTSGSTGVPKGVAIEHRSTVALLSWAAGLHTADELSGVLLSTSFSFDLSVYELFLPLVRGGRVIVAENALALPHLPARDEVRLINTVPSAIAALLREGGIPAGVTTVNLAGEPLRPELVDALYAAGIERVYDLYGPSEDTTYSTWTLRRPRAPATIGRPVANTQAYVLGQGMLPAPAGVAGELCLGGVGLARGYLGRPALTAERFVPDPFAGEPGGRLYRTGDRARWMAEGTLEYLGRMDHQVKLRGFRIEMGEVESALRRAPGVADCVAVVREDAPGERRLVAYVAGAADPDALRAELRRTLPEYMVPQSFVVLEALPLTPNGKLDRKALPAPDRAGSAGGHVAPRTPAEETLAAIWAEVLGRERVGAHDNFFALGGDSIVSIQVVSRARRAGLELSPRQLFEHQTVAELAAVASGASSTGAAEQGRVTGAVRLTPIQSWFLEQGHPAPWHFNQSVQLAVDPAVRGETLSAALAAVLDHHDALRLRFRRTDGGWEQLHADTAAIALETVDLSALGDDEQDREMDAQSEARQASLDLENGPLGRAVLFGRGARGRILLLVLHHLVVDGVSWRILREDLERACAQLESGQPVDLGAKSTSFRQWAQTLEAYAAGGTLSAEAAHWLAQGAEGVARLPVVGEGDPTFARARTLAVRLDEAETEALLREVPAAYRTQINDALLAALTEAVAGWTGGGRVRLALEGHGREEEIADGVDLTRTVGWFTSLYPVVLDLAGAAGPGERLKRVKEQLRAVPRRGIGYGVLRWMSPDEQVRGALAAQGEPEIVFNYLGQFDAPAADGGRFRFVRRGRVAEVAGENLRGHRLAVNGSISAGALEMSFTWDEASIPREAVERVAGGFRRALLALVEHCRQPGAGGHTPSDFPLAALSQGELDALLAGRGAVEDLYPLTPMQEGILFHARFGGEQQAYQIQVAQRLEGPLDEALFRRAWEEVTARHAILRTSFAWEGLRRPLQVVAAAAEVPWTAEDWSGLGADEQEAALERFLADDRARGFALDRAPLMRCALLRAGAEARWFVWSFHHLLADGWTSSRVLNQVFRLYLGWVGGTPVELPHERPFRDYLAWLGRQDPGAAERHWRGVLAGFDAPTPLGVDRPAAAGAPPRQARVESVLPADVTARLEAAARREQVTLNTVLQGAWGVLLSRYAGEDDVVFGATVSGRPAALPGVEEMMGLFINTLPVRVRVPGGAAAGEWLRGVQRDQARAREHEHAPLVRVQEWSEVPRGTPLFETLFVFENFPVEKGGTAAVGGLRVTAARAEEWTTYPLTFLAAPGREMPLSLWYDENRFHRAAVERMMDHLRRLLEQLADDPARPLDALEPLGDAERRQVVEAWNATAAPYPADTLHGAFAAQAARAPEAVALVAGDESLTYRELNARANRLAHHLRGLGVGPEARVGVMLERGADAVVALLAVLKAGGAYVPLDPAYPAERLAFTAKDAGVAVLVTRDALRCAVPLPVDSAVVSVDGDAAAIAAASDTDPESGAGPRNLAYLIYTSGSTGVPKGVAIEHRSPVALAHWAAGLHTAEELSGVLLSTSFAFDLSVYELFVPLLHGGRVIVAENALALPHLAAKDGVRLINTVPSAIAALLKGGGIPDGVTTVCLAGEPLRPDLVDALYAAGIQRVYDLYGPSEDTTYSTWTLRRPGAPATIGRPLANRRAYVTGTGMRPAPLGVPGELLLGGVGLARGYLGRPALTAERFVPDPFAAESGGRLYRTGDRARWTEEGTLQYLGRMDHQVKVRGFRIELGEIETLLRRQPGVADCVVVVREDSPGDARLVAYVAGAVEADALRAGLRRALPEHMVPGAFVVMERLPLTPNGKVDRKALPAPGAAGAADGYVAPRTPAEEVLAGIWAQVLGRDRVGARDNFFEIGGHSLLATQVVSRIRAVLGVETSLRALFEAPTVAELAGRVEALRRAGTSELPPLVPVDRSTPPPLSFAQERLWFLDRLQPGGSFYNIPVGLRLEGPLDAAALERALGEIVRRHEVLRTTVGEVDGRPVQLIAPFTGFHLPVEDLSGLDAGAREAALQARAAAEAARPFDLAAGPLFRPRLLRLSATEHGLLLHMHHLVTDGWSLDVLFGELAALYAAFRQGRPSPLPELAVQYADHAAWQRAHLSGQALERGVAWWRERLAGAPELLELPTDHVRPAMMSFRGAHEPVRLSAELSDRLQALARGEGATLFMVLLGAFQVMLSKYAGSDDVVVGTTIAGRTRGEAEGLIGLFMNTLALRTDLSGDPAFAEVLRRVRETTLGAYEHQEVPFERLVNEVRPGRSLGHTPLFQALFELHNTGAPGAGGGAAEALPGVKIGALSVGAGAAKFDLSVSLAAGPRGIEGRLTYAADLFEPATARRMVRHLERVLEQVAADPALRLSSVELMDDAERRVVVGEWNRTAAPFPAHATLHGLFEEQAGRTPDAVAVAFRDRTLTYRELDRRANRLANHLRRRGVGPEVRVALCLERGLESMIAILGVLKAGGAYVPLDPAYPVDRLRYMLEDSAAVALLTQERLRERIPVPQGVEVVRMDGAWAGMGEADTVAPATGVTAENLAYVIYTSGSTGRPKGVAMHHRGVVNYIHWGIRHYGADRGNGAPVFSSLAVDLTVTNLLPLFAGLPVRFLPEEAPVEALAHALRGAPGFGVLKITPVHLSLLTPLLTPEQARGAALTLVIGADFLAAEPTVWWQENAPGVRLMNEYGPTETVVGCSAYTLPPGVHRAGPVPVGGPIHNLTFYVLDAGMRPVPAGLPGELYIGGVGVARGYLGRPALSAEKFVPDPFAGGGARMYRTGDRARWLEGGNLMILGRTDNQVKVRGFRVETGEVEAVLRRHPGVSGCLVVVREDVPGDRRLVAYVVGDAGADELRAHLGSTLPEYMVPSAFVPLASLPQTATGKVDPRTLPAPEYAAAAPSPAPRTEVEREVAGVWREVLGVDEVGVHDNFFDLGGTSLLLYRVYARLRETREELRVVDLFRYPTVEALAGHLAAEAPKPGQTLGRSRSRAEARRAALSGD